MKRERKMGQLKLGHASSDSAHVARTVECSATLGKAERIEPGRTGQREKQERRGPEAPGTCWMDPHPIAEWNWNKGRHADASSPQGIHES